MFAAQDDALKLVNNGGGNFVPFPRLTIGEKFPASRTAQAVCFQSGLNDEKFDMLYGNHIFSFR